MSLLVIISAIASSRAASIRKNTEGNYDHPMDPFLLFLVMCPFVCSVLFLGWFTWNERKKRLVDTDTDTICRTHGLNCVFCRLEKKNVVDRTWAPNPLDGKCGSEIEMGERS